LTHTAAAPQTLGVSIYAERRQRFFDSMRDSANDAPSVAVFP